MLSSTNCGERTSKMLKCPSLHTLLFQGKDGRVRTAQAFTLVELLVSIAIVTVLAAILLPVLFQARGSTHKTTCESNLRSLGQSIRIYIDDNDGTWPGVSTWTSWNRAVTNVMDGCPIAPQPTYNLGYPTGYAYNAELANANPYIDDKYFIHLVPAHDKDILFPSTTVTLCDAANEAGITQASNPYKYVSPEPYGVERGWIRHNGGANYLFCEGHVKWYRSEEVLSALPPVNDGTKPSFALRTGRTP